MNIRKITINLVVVALCTHLFLGASYLIAADQQPQPAKASSLLQKTTTFISNNKGLALFGFALFGFACYLYIYYPQLFKPSDRPVIPANVSCHICLDDKKGIECSALSCKHIFCNDCLNQLIALAMKEQSTAELRCPECKKAMTEQDIRIVSKNNKDILDRYANIIAKELHAKNPNARYCPTPNCTHVFTIKQGQPQQENCPRCKHRYCGNCLYPHARTITCQQAEQQRPQDAATRQWKQQHTKECPRCRTTIERDAGCDWMKCTRCQYEFCWACLAPHDHNMAAHKCVNK